MLLDKRGQAVEHRHKRGIAARTDAVQGRIKLAHVHQEQPAIERGLIDTKRAADLRNTPQHLVLIVLGRIEEHFCARSGQRPERHTECDVNEDQQHDVRLPRRPVPGKER
ncbi:MAG: hypothetical protein ACD_10C00837G0002, partial [uncultured bacterium]